MIQAVCLVNWLPLQRHSLPQACSPDHRPRLTFSPSFFTLPCSSKVMFGSKIKSLAYKEKLSNSKSNGFLDSCQENYHRNKSRRMHATFHLYQFQNTPSRTWSMDSGRQFRTYPLILPMEKAKIPKFRFWAWSNGNRLRPDSQSSPALHSHIKIMEQGPVSRMPPGRSGWPHRWMLQTSEMTNTHLFTKDRHMLQGKLIILATTIGKGGFAQWSGSGRVWGFERF